MVLNANSFQDVANNAGITWSKQKGDEAFSVAWLDYNNDGFLDLWVSGHGYNGGGKNAAYPDGKYPYLYVNNGDGTFTNLFTEDWRRGNGGDTHGTSWIDFDNDGDPDLFVSAGGQEGEGSQPNHFFVNNSGTLEDESTARRLDYPFGRGRSSLWFDYNKDGLLDVLLVQAYRDDNLDGKFDTVQTEIDTNGDGIADTTVTAQTRTALFEQNADGTFSDVTDAVGLNVDVEQNPERELYNAGSDYAQLADVTGDGELDLILHGTYQFPLKVYDISTPKFQDITDTFPSVISSTLPSNPSNDFGRFNDAPRDSAIADFNNDGYNDIFLTRSFTYPQASSLYQGSDKILSADLLLDKAGEVGFDFSTTGNVAFDLLKYFNAQNALRENPINPTQYKIFIGAEKRKPTLAEVVAIADISSEYSVTAKKENIKEAGFALDPNNVTSLSSDRNEEGLYIGYDHATQTWQVRLTTSEALSTFPIRLAVESTENIVAESLNRVEFDPIDLSKNALPDILYIYDPATGEYIDSTVAAGLSNPTLAQSVVAGDFDNDMDVDLYLANSYSSFNVPNILYENQGNGTFIPVEMAGGAAGKGVGGVYLDFEIGQRLAVADYDNDGFLDIFAGSTTTKSLRKTYLGNPSQLFQNQEGINGNTNKWIEIDLQGIQSNRDAIGARVLVTTADSVTQVREQNGGSHVFAQNSSRLHFGLGQNDIITQIEVQWTSGETTILNDVPVNQILQIVEAFPSIITGDNASNLLSGTIEADQIIGLGGNDTLDGNKGNDSLEGGSGNDSLEGGSGNDTVLGNEGTDILKGGEGNDFLKGNSQADLLNGNNGSDTLQGGDDNDSLMGEDGNDRLSGDSGNDYLWGGNGADSLAGGKDGDKIFGETGNDSISGGEGDDFLTGETGNDSISGDEGNDTLNGNRGKDTLDGGMGNDTISAGEGSDTVNGSEGNDYLFGEGGSDLINGGDNSDTLRGGNGNDTLIGGAGNDHLVEVNNSDFILTDSQLITRGTDTISEFEFAHLIGGADDNVIDASIVTTMKVSLEGAAGDDTLIGGANDDTLRGLNQSDLLEGRDGNDRLVGGNGNDIFIGGKGNDTLEGGNGINKLVETADSNFILTNNQLISISLGTDRLFRIQEAQIIGGAGNNLLNAFATTAIKVTLEGGLGNDTIIGGSQADYLVGGADDDMLQGNDGNNTLEGNEGNDIIIGGNDSDVLVGGVGIDTVMGGNGNDSFTFNNLSEVGDQIIDFGNGDDKLVLSALGFGGGLAEGQTIRQEQFVVGTTALDNSDRVIYNSTTGDLFFDVDGTGNTAAVKIANLSGTFNLTTTDISIKA
ncbi:MAG: FG-GAP-like repeat-containing protein [Xenococcaceae cyanobacterium MO_188.B19]|nr:FG-GAP-like repeat-containing protein [Xenococcaceae cyanobacterium MO_188.B19]